MNPVVDAWTLKLWQAISINTPPPDMLGIQNQGLCGPQCSSAALERYGLPEIKYYGVVVEVGKNMETSVEGVYVAGDGAGLSRGINIAATTGVLATRSIVSSL